MKSPADIFFTDGCGRCSLMSTPACKVQTWKKVLAALRPILLSSGLTEERKWGMPCYTLGKANVVMLAAFKAHCSISFFKGSLLEDPKGLLEKAGENSQSGRQFRFTSPEQVKKMEKEIKSFLTQAIAIEQSGKKPERTVPKELPLSEEFQQALDKSAKLKKAFESLTPGRQRSWHLYISGAKQSKTREDRVAKAIPLIMEGKGWNEY